MCLMCEDNIKLIRTQGLKVDPCNVDGRQLVARIETHLFASPQPDAWKAAELEHAKFLQRKYQKEERSLRLDQAMTQRLQGSTRTKQRKEEEEKQALIIAARRQHLQQFSQGVTLRNQTRLRPQQLTLQAIAVSGPVPRLPHSSPRRSRSRTSSRLLTASRGAQAQAPSTLGRSSYSLRRGQWLQTSCRSMSPDRACPTLPAESLSVAASSLQIHDRAGREAKNMSRPAEARRQRISFRPAPMTKGVQRAPGNAARLANLAWKVKDKKIQLPQLCMCHQVSPLLPEYPFHCASNCPLFRNPEAHEAMVRSLVQAYGISS